MSILRLPKYHNPIGVGAFVVVIDAPAVGGFGEFLVIEENYPGFEARRQAA